MRGGYIRDWMEWIEGVRAEYFIGVMHDIEDYA